jgi:putative ABC transport system permease protein
MSNLFNDVRYAARSLLRNPGFTIVVVATLAIGIGANTAIFSVVNSVLLRPLPYAGSDRLVMLWGNYDRLKIERLPAKAAEYEDYAKHKNVFEELAAYSSSSFTVTGTGEPQRIRGTAVSSNLFSLLQASPIMGSTFTPNDRQSVILSYGYWQRQFGGDPAVLGRQVSLDEQDFTIVGVMPRTFEFPHSSFSWSEPADIWIPNIPTPEQLSERRGPYYLNVLGRLAPGVKLDQARAEMKLLGERFERELPGYRGPNGEDGGWRITVSLLHEEVVGKSSTALVVLSFAVGALLLIACANVANLLLMRLARRSRELTIRAALGATRWRIVRLLSIEAALLTSIGAALGLVLVKWGLSLFSAMGASVVPRAQEIDIDGRVLAFTVLISAIVCCGFALVPLSRVSTSDLSASLKSKAESARRHWSNVLVVSEVALALVLLIGSLLLVRSLWRLQHVDAGLVSAQLISAELDLSPRYGEAQQSMGFYADLLKRLESLPGVDHVSFGTVRPLSGRRSSDPFAVEGRKLDPTNLTAAGWQIVGPNYFRTMGTSLVRGRDLVADDFLLQSAPVAVINEKMATKYWPNEDPIGRRITLGLPRPGNPWVTIVGVSRNVPHSALEAPAEPEWYISRSAAGPRHAYVYLRSAIPVEILSKQIRQVVAGIDPYQPVSKVETLSDVIARTTAPRRFNAAVLTVFGVVALILSTLGIYSVVSYSVTLRTHELGIRLALGADRVTILKLVLRHGLLLSLIGVVIGIAAALGLTRLMVALLFDVSPMDPLTYVVIVIVGLVTALAASVVPAMRATRVDPLRTLRAE